VSGGGYGSLFADPVGFFKPVAAGGGGSTKVGSGVFRYTAADGNDCRFTMLAELNRITLNADTAFEHSVTNTHMTLNTDVAFDMDVSADMTLYADTAFEHSVTRVQITPSQMLAGKDSWVDVTAGCVGGGTNHDGSDLQCEGLPTSRKDPIFGWDLSGFPSNATVLSADVTLNQISAPGVTGTNTLNTISSANETWTEGGVVCNNIPAAASSAGTFSNSGTGEKTISLNSTGLSAIETAMGSTSFSLRMTTTALVTNHSFESADEGTNDTLGPRLDVVFTVPV
jgi:hypothetical protein